MSLRTEPDSNDTIPVRIHIVDDTDIIGRTVNDTSSCTTDRLISSDAFVLYITDIQKKYNSTYSFAISYDESTQKAIEIKSIPMKNTSFSNMTGFGTTMLMIVLHKRQEKKNNANSTRRRRRPHQRVGTRKHL